MWVLLHLQEIPAQLPAPEKHQHGHPSPSPCALVFPVCPAPLLHPSGPKEKLNKTTQLQKMAFRR